MEPGRELDALIAEKVIGLEVVKNKSGSKRGGYYYSIGDAYWCDIQGEMYISNSLSRYSTDIAAAWEVVEKLTFVFTLTTNPPYAPTTPETEWMASFNADESVHGCSAPHAICLAALKALGVTT